MRTTVIPAQITTVEDKIAGNLSLTQIFILMIPVFCGTFIYVAFIPSMHLVIYKVILTLIIAVACLILSFRFKGKIILNWLSIILAYNLRPRYYIFNKNDIYQRDIVISITKLNTNCKQIEKQAKVAKKQLVKDIKHLEKYIKSEKYGLTVKPNKKGGFNAAFYEVKQ